MIKMIKINQLFLGLLLVIPTMFFPAQEQLREGVETGDVEKVEKAIAAGASINGQYGGVFGENPLYTAVAEGYVKIIKLLLDKGANVNEIGSKNNDFPLGGAASRGDVKIIELLLDAGAKINLRDGDGYTPLAIVKHKKKDYEEIIKFIIDKGDHTINLRDIQGRTPLMEAALNEDVAETRLLLKKGAEVDMQDNKGVTALLHVLSSEDDKRPSKDYLGLVKLLVNDGANVNGMNDSGQERLWGGVKNGIIEDIKKAIADGANINEIDEYGYTALSFAKRKKNDYVKSIKLLIDRGADIINERDFRGETPLMKAAENGDLAKTKSWIEKGADVNMQDDLGYTALHNALALGEDNDIWKQEDMWPPSQSKGYLGLVTLLVNAGANINLKTNQGEMPLMEANSPEAAALLLKKGAGAHINDTDDLGETALMQAALQDHPEVVKLLLEDGAFPDMRNKKGETAREIAKKFGYKDVIAVLDEFRERKEKELE
jgi:ankyrin repeat protein